MRRWPCDLRRPDGSEPPGETRVGVEPTSTDLQSVAWPSGSRVLNEQNRINAPARSRTWASTFAGSRASLTLRGRFDWGESPRQELNLVLDVRSVACDPTHSRGRDQRSSGRMAEQRRKDSNPVIACWRRAALPGAHLCVVMVDSSKGCPTGFEPVLRGPQPRVLPLHHGHHRCDRLRSGLPGNRTPISCVQDRCLPLGPAARIDRFGTFHPAGGRRGS